MRRLVCLLVMVCFLTGASAAAASADVVDDHLAGIVLAPGQVGIFARGDAGTLLARAWEGSGWTTWTDLGGMSMTSGPSADVRPDGTVDVFAKGPDNAIYHRYLSGGVWSDWGSIGGTLTSAPSSAARLGTDKLDVVAKGSDNAVWFKSWSPASGWSAWVSLGGGFLYSPTITSTEAGKINVWGVGTDNQLYQKHWDGSSWTGWMPLGGTLTSTATVVSQGAGLVDVFARDANSNIAQRSWNGSSWSPWVWIPTVATSAPFAYSEGYGRVDLYVRGGTQVYQNQYSGGAWLGWQPWGSTSADPDSVMAGVEYGVDDQPFAAADDPDAEAASLASASGGSCKHKNFWIRGHNLAGLTLTRLNHDIRWCWSHGKISYYKRIITTATPMPFWTTRGRWTLQQDGGVGATFFRSVASQKFGLCGGIGPLSGCAQEQTLVSDAYMYPGGGWGWGPLKS